MAQESLFTPQDYRTPGQLVQELLEARGWTQRTLAIVLGASETAISKLIGGTQSLTAEMALGLSEVFGVAPEQLMRLRKEFELEQARIVARPDPKRKDRAILFGALPVTEMIKRGWLPGAADILDVPQVESELAKFFGVSSVEQIEILPHAAKKTDVSEPATPSQLAWLYRVKQIAGEILVGRYSPESVSIAIDRLSALRATAENVGRVPRILQEAGIRFVVVETLTGANIDGVCFWLNEKSPVIGMSLRYDRIDNFWFVLRHELEHVRLLHGLAACMIDAELEGERAGTGQGIPQEERLANEAAADFCVPRKSFHEFVSRKAPFFATRDVVGFARTIKVHPGLVAGQLQHFTGRYRVFRDHLVKIRGLVQPNAFSDGWGDIFPTEN